MVEHKQQGWVNLGHKECERSMECPRKHWILGLEFWRAHSVSDMALRNGNIQGLFIQYDSSLSSVSSTEPDALNSG